MAKKLTVATDAGTFTRRTERAYAFVVVSRGQHAATINAHYDREQINFAEQRREYAAVVEAGQVPADYGSTLTVADYQGFVVDVEERLATLEARRAADLAKAEASPFAVQGWSSRLDLARKMHDTAVGYGYMDVRIYDVATGERVR
jgi:hypothetical protein